MLSIGYLKTLTDRQLNRELASVNYRRKFKRGDKHLGECLARISEEITRRANGGNRDMVPWQGMDDPRNQEL